MIKTNGDNNKYYPKVVILYETFNSKTGGGITLTNLFRGWPKDHIANIVDASMKSQILSDSVCENFYILGDKERKALSLFSFMRKKYKSGIYKYRETNSNGINQSKTSTSSFKSAINNIFRTIFKYTGLHHIIYRYEISPELTSRIKEFNPDVIYSQLSNNRQLFQFTLSLKEITKAKIAIHIMDDWPTTISKKGLFKHYWQNRINSELRGVFNKSDIFLSISEGMSNAYLERYGIDFIPFHNPIDTNDWLIHTKKDILIANSEMTVLYAGRIGIGTSDSVVDIAKAIDDLITEGYNIKFKIQTTSIDPVIKQKLTEYKCVIFNPLLEYCELPAIFAGADLLVMPIDFDCIGMDYLRYSMPTKASEYMISGTPILLYCDQNVSLYTHAKKYKWAYTVTENNTESLKKGIIKLLTDNNLRSELSKNAINHSLSNYDSSIVRTKFRECLANSPINNR